MLIAGVGALAGISLAGARPATRFPLIHCTDLYHPPQDPDDHIDLATVAALGEYDLRGVICDVTTRFLQAAPAGWDIRREPGLVPIAQLARLLGREIPSAVGPPDPLVGPDDDCRNRSAGDQRAITFLLELLEQSDRPVVISVVGSARVLTAAFNRNPALVRRTVHAILLNAGSTGGAKQEWNVGLDPAAYIGLWRSGLPIWWYPCATGRGAFNPDDERGTYWSAAHANLFRDLSPAMRAWFHYAFAGIRSEDDIGALHEPVGQDEWEKLLQGRRNLWATASLVMGAGRGLFRTPAGWRFLPAAAAGDSPRWPWRCEPIAATVTDGARVEWAPAPAGGNSLLFWRRKGKEFGEAMAEALGELLGTLPG